MEKTLAKDEIDILRSHGVLNSHEIALRIGDIIIAENVIVEVVQSTIQALNNKPDTKK